MMQRNNAEVFDALEKLAVKTIKDCTFLKKVQYSGKETREFLLLPSGDEKYISFWVRDCVMMAESGLLPDHILKKYIEIFAHNGQNGKETLLLENGLTVPPYTIADHINYDGKPVYFPGTYASGDNQGSGNFGFYPPHCDNYFYIIMVGTYIKQSGDRDILDKQFGEISMRKSLEYAFKGHNIDPQADLCVSNIEKYTVDWGFTDAIKKSGKLLMASLLRYNAARTLQVLFGEEKEKSEFYRTKAEKIKNNIISEFYDNNSGWFYSSTEVGKQYDVWATAYAVFLNVTREEKTLKALYGAYADKTAVVDGYVRHILTTNDFSADSAWEYSRIKYNTYENGGYWATPTGWYAYALYLYTGKTDILNDFLNHTQRYEKEGAPFEWINETTTEYSGLKYGTSGVLPYIGMMKINDLEEIKQHRA